jgi:heme A synthase
MAPKRRTDGASRISVIERVTTPLAFFTLGLLIVEVILGTLSAKASGSNQTILIVGMLGGFVLLCSTVIVMTVYAPLRHALLGTRPEVSPIAALLEMQLTPNDIRLVNYLANKSSMSGTSFHHAAAESAKGEQPLPPEARLIKFKQLNLVRERPGYGYTLSPEGQGLAKLITDFAKPFTDDHDQFRRI